VQTSGLIAQLCALTALPLVYVLLPALYVCVCVRERERERESERVRELFKEFKDF
jgi:hypothetical protein